MGSQATTRFHHAPRGRRPLRAYVLLETVVATGLLTLGLAMLGSQVQQADTSIRRMELRLRALMLAEMQLAHMDTGLIELNSVDNIEEKDFGPRYPDYGWRLTTDETTTEDLYRLTLEVLYARRADYEEEDFDHDNAEVLYTFYFFRARPRPLNFAEDFGLREDELEDLAERLNGLGIEGLDVNNFDPSIFAKLDTEQLMESLPVLLSAFGMDISQLLAGLPPDVRAALEASGMLEELAGGGDETGGGQ